MEQHYIQFQDVTKSYGTGNARINALEDVTFGIDEGEFCILLGSSGAGNTTLLNMLGGMDTVSSGEIYFHGKEVSAFKKRELVEYRRHDVGFVFQFYNLIPTLTAKENVEIAAQLCKNPIPAEEALSMVGLSERTGNFPAQLSGWEQQRVAIARALAKNPELLLCDEPTGALDSRSAYIMMELLAKVNEQGQTIIMVTHSIKAASYAKRVLFIKDGQVFHQIFRGNRSNEEMFSMIAQTQTILINGGDLNDRQ